MKEALPEDFRIIYSLLWCREYDYRDCNLRRLINSLAIKTRLRRTFNESDNEFDDTNETLLIYYRFNENILLPRFTSKVISVFNARKDKREYTRFNKDKFFQILGTGKIAKLSISEQNFVLHKLEEYVDSKLKTTKGEIEILCK